MSKSKSIVFISVPYSQNPERGEELSLLAGMFIRSVGKTPFSPVFNFQRFFSNGNGYDAVLEDCLVLLNKCDEVLCVEEDGCLSNGQSIECNEAYKLNKQVVKVTPEVLIDLLKDYSSGLTFILGPTGTGMSTTFLHGIKKYCNREK